MRSFFIRKWSEVSIHIDKIILHTTEIRTDSDSQQLGLVNSFPARTYTAPYLFSNCHFQTIVGSGALQSMYFGPPPRNFETTTESIITPDGDFFDIELSSNVQQAKAIVLILHGLESSAKSNIVTNFANAFYEKGFACCLVSFRGCNGQDNR